MLGEFFVNIILNLNCILFQFRPALCLGNFLSRSCANFLRLKLFALVIFNKNCFWTVDNKTKSSKINQSMTPKLEQCLSYYGKYLVTCINIQQQRSSLKVQKMFISRISLRHFLRFRMFMAFILIFSVITFKEVSFFVVFVLNKVQKNFVN